MRRAIGAALTLAIFASNNLVSAGELVASQTISRKAAAQSNAAAHSRITKSTVQVTRSKTMQTRVDKAPLVEQYLLDGNLIGGEAKLKARLESHPKDDQARFGLGVLQFLRAIEGLSQDFYRYGLRNLFEGRMRLPMYQLPISTNPVSEPISYQKARDMIDKFDKRLATAEATLAQVTDPGVRLPLHFGEIKMDFTSYSSAEQKQGLWRLYANITNNTHISEEQSKSFYIKFDRGDVHWLRGYCNVFMTICDIYLAHDSKELFDRTAQMFFTKVDSPYETFDRDVRIGGRVEHMGDLLDFGAMVHLLRCNVVEPQRMESALHHMEAVVVQSRETWRWIMAETDDDHEWLPNPRQTGVIPGAHVTEEMVTAWGEIMDESEKILSGKLLVPFWRGDGKKGINVRKVFLEPRTFDLILWVQGSDVVPYLESGEMTKGNTWSRLTGEFGHHFPGFAIWFN